MILTTIKDNVKETAKILKGWEKNLMFERKEGKTYTFEELNESFKALISQRHGEIRDGGGWPYFFLSSELLTLGRGYAERLSLNVTYPPVPFPCLPTLLPTILITSILINYLSNQGAHILMLPPIPPSPGKEITKLLSSSNRVLKVSKGVASWKKYVEYFQDIVIEGLSTGIINTVRYLINQIDADVSLLSSLLNHSFPACA